MLQLLKITHLPKSASTSLLTLFPLHAIPALRRQIEATCCLLQNDFLDPGVERHTFLLRGLFIVLPPSPVAYSSPEQYMRS